MVVGEPVVENETETFALFTNDPVGGAPMATVGSGATVKAVDAVPTLPAASVAVTRIVWLPVESALYA